MTPDTFTIQFMTTIQNEFLTALSKSISIVTETAVLLTLGLIISLFLSYKYSKRKGIIYASSLILTGIIIYTAKEIFYRARPITSLVAETGFSFPSGHATMSTVFFLFLASLLSKKYPKRKIASYTIAIILITIVSLSRLYLQVHYLTDVLGGIFIGLIIFLTSIKFLR